MGAAVNTHSDEPLAFVYLRDAAVPDVAQIRAASPDRVAKVLGGFGEGHGSVDQSLNERLPSGLPGSKPDAQTLLVGESYVATAAAPVVSAAVDSEQAVKVEESARGAWHLSVVTPIAHRPASCRSRASVSTGS